jgi:hypothetical protein
LATGEHANLVRQDPAISGARTWHTHFNM